MHRTVGSTTPWTWGCQWLGTCSKHPAVLIYMRWESGEKHIFILCGMKGYMVYGGIIQVIWFYMRNEIELAKECHDFKHAVKLHSVWYHDVTQGYAVWGHAKKFWVALTSMVSKPCTCRIHVPGGEGSTKITSLRRSKDYGTMLSCWHDKVSTVIWHIICIFSVSKWPVHLFPKYGYKI